MTDFERPPDPSATSGQFQVPHEPYQTGPCQPYQQNQPSQLAPHGGPYGHQPAVGPYGHQPPQYRSVAPPADKSVGVSVLLTFLFGSFGLFYSSVLGGLIMTVVEIIAVVVGVLTFGIGLILFVAIWPATMVWGALSASRKHRNFESWRIQQMQLAMYPHRPQ